MATKQRFRNYSSDSVGSDRVFIEDSRYHGVIGIVEYRKGRVSCRVALTRDNRLFAASK